MDFYIYLRYAGRYVFCFFQFRHLGGLDKNIRKNSSYFKPKNNYSHQSIDFNLNKEKIPFFLHLYVFDTHTKHKEKTQKLLLRRLFMCILLSNSEQVQLYKGNIGPFPHIPCVYFIKNIKNTGNLP